MTKLRLDPDALPLHYPHASPAQPAKLRLVAQVSQYDHVHALLFLRRVPNLPQLHTYVALDDASDVEPPAVPVDVSHVVQDLTVAHTSVGAIVSVLGFYNGERVVAVECFVVDGQVLLDGRSVVVAEVATLGDI